MSLLLDQGDRSSTETASVVVALRQNVQTAVRIMGNALLQHAPASRARAWLSEPSFSAENYYAALLHLAYRLMFLLVAEHRDLLHPEHTSPSIRQLYKARHSVSRLSRLLDHEYDPNSTNLWQGTRGVLSGLAHGDATLGLAPLGGLFAEPEHSIFATSTLDNRTFMEVMRLLALVRNNDASSAVDWAVVSGEELGSLYEQLLELTPKVDADSLAFDIEGDASGASTRRTSGSYYTPSELVDVVIRNALDRTAAKALCNARAERESLLGLRIVDPACGCGHFLLAAARRLAQHLEPYLAESSSQPSRRTQALRQVIANCIYGVDLNPTAIELCKANLWLEASEPGTSMAFLDTHLQQGNALIGAPMASIEAGIPSRALRSRRKAQPQALKRPDEQSKDVSPSSLVTCLSSAQRSLLSDVWCAAFFWPASTTDDPTAPTALVWATLLESGVRRPASTLATARELSAKHSFFHWHLRFPEVFEAGGFDVVLGNPPWIAHAGRAAQPLDASVKHFFTCNYPAFSRYITTHGLFASVLPRLLRPGGYLGFVIPSSLSELAGYEPTRRAHDALCTFVDELTDFGEGRFEGVTQPCMALVTQRDTAGRTDAAFGSPWPVARPDLSPADRALLSYVHTLPTLPPTLFAERGLQSDATLRAHFLASKRACDRFTVPVREGTDVREFELLPARFFVDPIALGKRLRPPCEFQEVGVVVRQTARYPIAAISDGLAFRNSLLACLSHPSLSAQALVALLNSTLVRWHHYMRFRDARQPVLPQVKISHLRAIPGPPIGLDALNSELHELGALLTANTVKKRPELRAQLDEVVAKAYGLTESQTALLRAWRHA